MVQYHVFKYINPDGMTGIVITVSMHYELGDHLMIGIVSYIAHLVFNIIVLFKQRFLFEFFRRAC